MRYICGKQKQGLDKGPPGVTLHSILRSAKTTSAPLPPNSFAGPTYMLNFRSAYFWPLLWQMFYTSWTPAMNLITHTNSHEPCHLGTPCPSDANGSGTVLEAPRPQYLRADTVRYQNLCIWKNHSWSPINFLMASHERPWQIMLAIVQNDDNLKQLPLAVCLPLPSLVPTFGGNEQSTMNIIHLII